MAKSLNLSADTNAGHHRPRRGDRSMSPEIQTVIEELRERLTRLESIHTKSSRGRCNQRKAADYIGKSREYLRKLALRGEGPRRAADGSYSYDDLDAFSEGNRA
jgi:hypothetical protein